MTPGFEPASEADFEALVALRIELLTQSEFDNHFVRWPRIPADAASPAPSHTLVETTLRDGNDATA